MLSKSHLHDLQHNCTEDIEIYRDTVFPGPAKYITATEPWAQHHDSPMKENMMNSWIRNEAPALDIDALFSSQGQKCCGMMWNAIFRFQIDGIDAWTFIAFQKFTEMSWDKHYPLVNIQKAIENGDL
jgi:hypothetical protein